MEWIDRAHTCSNGDLTIDVRGDDGTEKLGEGMPVDEQRVTARPNEGRLVTCVWCDRRTPPRELSQNTLRLLLSRGLCV